MKRKKSRSSEWHFVFNSNFTECYQFCGTTLMWVIGGRVSE